MLPTMCQKLRCPGIKTGASHYLALTAQCTTTELCSNSAVHVERSDLWLRHATKKRPATTHLWHMPRGGGVNTQGHTHQLQAPPPFRSTLWPHGHSWARLLGCQRSLIGCWQNQAVGFLEARVWVRFPPWGTVHHVHDSISIYACQRVSQSLWQEATDLESMRKMADDHL